MLNNEKNILIEALSVDELRLLIIDILQAELAKIFPSQKIQTKVHQELISRKEAAAIIGASVVTLDKLVKEGSIKGYRIGKLIRFKRQDLYESLHEIRTLKYKRPF